MLAIGTIGTVVFAPEVGGGYMGSFLIFGGIGFLIAKGIYSKFKKKILAATIGSISTLALMFIFYGGRALMDM